jgi:hypothetical protein
MFCLLKLLWGNLYSAFDSFKQSYMIRQRRLLFLWYIAFILLAAGCASTGSPTGGPRDLTPPVLDTIRSDKNRQINFRPSLLNFYFDEFVEVQEPIKQVLVSPPLTYIPQVKHRGKKVTFAFDEKEILRENATYTINFGEAIVDYHESNKLSNFSFVFSTGSVIDSLSLKGSVVNALTGEPEKEMVVFLYDNLKDSAAFFEKPFYFARTDKEGKFIFSNIKSDTFRLLAIADENLNYRYDLESEKIAFYDSLIVLNSTFNKNIELVASNPVPSLKIQAVNARQFGKINIQCNTMPVIVPDYLLVPDSVNHVALVSGDSLQILYNTGIDSFTLITLRDTLVVRPRGRADFISKSKFRRDFSRTQLPVLPADSLVIAFNQPIQEVNKGKVRIFDSIGVLNNIDLSMSKDKKSLIAKHAWTHGARYTISVDSGALTSMYQLTNDSSGASFTILKADKLASLKIGISELDNTANYLIHILKDNIRLRAERVSNQTNYTMFLSGLVPDRYDVVIIMDLNQNGVWDAGDYWKKKQPEPYRRYKGEKLRENWEAEMNISYLKGLMQGNEPISPVQGLESNPLLQQQRKK